MREEKARGEAEKLGRECHDLRWRWGEDVGIWRRREGEVRSSSLLSVLASWAPLFIRVFDPLDFEDN